MHWADLFGRAEFRFPMGLEQGEVKRFFAATAAGAPLLSERCRILTENPHGHALLAESGVPLIVETEQLLIGAPLQLADRNGSRPEHRCRELGCRLEPDFLLLDASPELRVVGLCVCFPSSWAPEEKFGRPLAEVHEPVPGLNPQLGSRIRSFFERLKPGLAWERSNWGLSHSPDLNQHPARSLPKLGPHVAVDEVWLRVEHQLLYRLPQTGGVLFGIRIENVSLVEVQGNSNARAGLHRQLATMPDEVLAYKGLAAAQERLLDLLQPSEKSR